MKKFLLYILRWQLSTPVIWVIIRYLNLKNVFMETVIANFFGSLIFFWIDRFIFRIREKS